MALTNEDTQGAIASRPLFLENMMCEESIRDAGELSREDSLLDALWQYCPMCRGKGTLPPDTRMCIDPPAARAALERLPDGSYRCVSCDGQRYVPVGLGMSQVSALAKRVGRLMDQVRDLSAQLADRQR